MSMRSSTSTPIWKKTWLWLAVVAAILLAVRLLPSTTDNPLDVGANDKEFHIGLKPLPSGWHTDWITDSGSARRVSLTSPDGEVDIDILAYKGELDRDKFTQIGSLLFGSSFPAPYNKVDTIEYGAEIQRSSYKEVITDHRTIYTSIDVLWHEAMEDYAYIVVARSIQESNPNVELAREHLRFSPPRLTALGHVKKWCTDGGEFLESGETLFALLSWILVTGWGIWYLWKKLDKKWKPLKYIVGAGIVGLTVATRTILALSWLGTGVVIFLLVAVIGVATALLTGAWNFED